MEFKGKSPIKAVRLALSKLHETEKEVIIRYYYMGQSHRQIAQYYRAQSQTIRTIRLRSVEKLKYILTPFVQWRYNISNGIDVTCPLCKDNRLDNLIISCAPYGPWGQVIKEAKALGIHSLKSVSTIIYHYKHHLKNGG